MRRVRFSVRSFLIAIAAMAAALGALESNSELIVSLVFSLNVAMLCFALAGAIVAAGTPRTFWVGYIVFGGLYSLVAFGILFPQQPNYGNVWLGYGRRESRPELFTTHLLEMYAGLRGTPRRIGDKVSAQWSGGGYYPATIIAIQDGKYDVQWDDGSRPERVSLGQMQPQGRDLQRVGHSLFALLFGFLGGLAAVCCLSPRGTPYPPGAPTRPLAA